MSIHRPPPALIPLLVVLSLALAGCGSSASSTSSAQPQAAAGSAAPTAAASTHVQISGFGFHPAKLTVHAGAHVTFTNRDQTAHTATSAASGVFDTGTLNPGQSRTVVLTKPGTYAYYCQFHAFMRGTIVVR